MRHLPRLIGAAILLALFSFAFGCSRDSTSEPYMPDDYDQFMDRAIAEGVDVPILSGISKVRGFGKKWCAADATAEGLVEWANDSARLYEASTLTVLRWADIVIDIYCPNQHQLVVETAEQMGVKLPG